jgi:hypothetical protein
MRPNLKTLLYTTIALASQLTAQPVLNLSGLPPFGTTKTTTLVDGTGINPGPAGANQTWNFSAFPDTGTINTLVIAEPSETPFYSQFPTATSVSIIETSIDGADYYFNTYTRASEDALELLGTVIHDGSLEDVYSTVFINPETIFAFPATLNSVNTDTYESPANSFDPENTITGNTSYTVDGYGTLVTNSGTYPNTLRFKRREIVLDTFLFSNPKIEIPIYSESRNTTYEWVHIQNGGSFTVWTISYDTSSTGFGPPQETFSSSTNHTYGEVNVGSSKLNSVTALGTFPNPASNQVLIMLPEAATVTVFDLGGRAILAQEFSLSSSTMPILDISALPSGTYITRAKGKTFSSSAKLIIAH